MTKILLCYSRKEDVPEGIKFLESNRILFWGKDLNGVLSRPPPYEIFFGFKGSKYVTAVGKAVGVQKIPIVEYLPNNWEEHSDPKKYNNYFLLVELKNTNIRMNEIAPDINRWPQNIKYLD